MTNTKMIVNRILSDLVPSTGLISQSGPQNGQGTAQWRFARPVRGLEAYEGKSFSSEAEAMQVLGEHYEREFDKTPRNVAGIGPGIVDPNATPNPQPSLTPQHAQREGNLAPTYPSKKAV